MVPASYAINKRLQPYRLSYQDVVSDRFQADSYEPVPLELFKDTPFIIMKPGNDMYQRGFSMCRNAGFTPKVAIQMDQVLTSMNIASNGVGAVFIRSDIIGCLPENKKLVYYKIGDPLGQPQGGVCQQKRKIYHSGHERIPADGRCEESERRLSGQKPCKDGRPL